MQNQIELETPSVFSLSYWREAAAAFKDIKMITFAAMIVALRVIAKYFEIPIAAGVSLYFSFIFNSLGSMVYGPVMGFVGGTISDTIGVLVKGGGWWPLGFISEAMGSFLFGLFFWRRKITPARAICAKFTVNMICNVIIMSLLYKHYMGYALINLPRIVKNLLLFPAEGIVMVFTLSAAMPVLKSAGLVKKAYLGIDLKDKNSIIKMIVLAVCLFVLSAALVCLYIFYLHPILKNIKFL